VALALFVTFSPGGQWMLMHEAKRVRERGPCCRIVENNPNRVLGGVLRDQLRQADQVSSLYAD
jgi:hypothetical protein